MRILALDPGERVGWAVAECDDELLVPWHISEEVTVAAPELRIVNHGISFLKDMALAVHDRAFSYNHVVYETWRLQANKARTFAGSDFPSVQFIGMVRMACWLNPTVTIHSQSPSTKSTADRVIPLLYPDIDGRIKAAPAAHDDSHDTDALRHLAYWHYRRFIAP